MQNNLCFQLSCKQPVYFTLDWEKKLKAPLITCLMGVGISRLAVWRLKICDWPRKHHIGPPAMGIQKEFLLRKV